MPAPQAGYVLMPLWSPRRGGGWHAVEVPLPFDERASEAAWVIRSTLAAWVDELRTASEPASERKPAPMEVWMLERTPAVAVLPDVAKGTAGRCRGAAITDSRHSA